MILFVLVCLLFLAFGGGAWGHSRYGAVGWSPFGVLFFVLMLLYFTGNIHGWR